MAKWQWAESTTHVTISVYVCSVKKKRAYKHAPYNRRNVKTRKKSYTFKTDIHIYLHSKKNELYKHAPYNRRNVKTRKNPTHFKLISKYIQFKVKLSQGSICVCLFIHFPLRTLSILLSQPLEKQTLHTMTLIRLVQTDEPSTGDIV